MPLDEPVYPELPPGAKLTLYGMLWAIWAAVPLIVLIALIPSKSPVGLLFLRSWWTVLIYAWAISLVALCWWLLSSMNGAAGVVDQCSLGILCSLSLGLPAILLGAIPFFALDVKSLHQMFPHGNVVDLRGNDVHEVRKERQPNLYVVGIDVSSGFLPVHEISGRAEMEHEEAHRETRMERIRDTILDLFETEKGVVGRKLHPNDVLIVWPFWSEPSTRAWARSDLPDTSVRAIMKRIESGELAKDIPGWRPEEDKEPADVLEFFDAVVDAEAEKKKYERVRVILFSDLVHGRSVTNYDSYAEEQNAVDGAVERLLERIDGMDLSVIAFTAPPPQYVEGRPDKIVSADLRAYFNGRLGRSTWQAVDLERFRTLGEVGKRVHLAPMYDNVIPTDTLCLKYDISSDERALDSYVMIEDDVSNLEVAFRKQSANADSEISDDNVAISVGHHPEVLELSGRRQSSGRVRIDRGQGSWVPVRVGPGSAAGDPAAELFIETAPNTLHRVPVTIMPVDTTKGDAVRAFGVVLFVLNFVPIVLAIHSWRSRKRAYEAARSPKAP